jgi:predicted benzoate:H+ symporter BenE
MQPTVGIILSTALKSWLKRNSAVIVGFLAIVVLASITDAILTKTGAFPDKPEEYTAFILVIALAYYTVFAILGGLVVMKLAPSNR